MVCGAVELTQRKPPLYTEYEYYDCVDTIPTQFIYRYAR